MKRATIPLLLLGLCIVTGSCGSSGGVRTGSARYSQALRFSECMRAHGLPSFPDPSSGGGIHIEVASGLKPFSPAFRTAQAACHKLLPGGGPGAQHPSAALKAQMLRISECMRSHGVSGFPDPTYSPPSDPADYSLLLNRGGVILAVPRTVDPGSPSFRQAASACHFS